MKRLFLHKLTLCIIFIALGFSASAQVVTLIGPRLLVKPPASSQGFKEFTYSADGNHTGTNLPWGADITINYLNRPLIITKPDSACTGLTNAAAFAGGGKWALIRRGNCDFSAKAYNAQLAGAEGVIIANWKPNDALINMAAGSNGSLVTIPVLFISKEDGDLIHDEISGGANVNIDIIRWGFGNAHDLAFMQHSTPYAHAGAIPKSQTASGTPYAYNLYTGGWVANTGTSTETNVRVITNTYFTPTGGSSSLVASDSVLIAASFPTTDSLNFDYGSTHKNYNTNQTGEYKIVNTVHSDAIDQQLLDNKITDSFLVTNTAFSKGRYNLALDRPIISSAARDPNVTGAFTWGPLYYVTTGGYSVDSVSLGINDNDTSKHSLAAAPAPAMGVFIYKWRDGTNGGASDSVIQLGELTLVGKNNPHVYTTADSNNKPFTSLVTDLNNNPLVVESNTWYWVASEVPAGTFLGIDSRSNQWGRVAGARKNGIKDYWAPEYQNDQASLSADITGNPNDNLFMYGLFSRWTQNTPFEPIDSLFNPTFGDVIPNIAMYFSPVPVAVKDIHASNLGDVNLFPNPAIDFVTVSTHLTSLSNSVSYKLTDIYGKTIATETKSNVKDADVKFSIANLAAGQYFIVITSDNGSDYRSFTKLGK